MLFLLWIDAAAEFRIIPFPRKNIGQMTTPLLRQNRCPRSRSVETLICCKFDVRIAIILMKFLDGKRQCIQQHDALGLPCVSCLFGDIYSKKISIGSTLPKPFTTRTYLLQLIVYLLASLDQT